VTLLGISIAEIPPPRVDYLHIRFPHEGNEWRSRFQFDDEPFGLLTNLGDVLQKSAAFVGTKQEFVAVGLDWTYVCFLDIHRKKIDHLNFWWSSLVAVPQKGFAIFLGDAGYIRCTAEGYNIVAFSRYVLTGTVKDGSAIITSELGDVVIEDGSHDAVAVPYAWVDDHREVR
jgi:hypothetical protein